MGAYKKERIERDFELAARGVPWPVVNLMSIAAKAILETIPDNMTRDMAISHLLQSAEMVTNAYVLDNAVTEPENEPTS